MKDTELFLCAMRERHGIGEEFVEAARPLIDAIYAEFDGDVRAELLDFAESVFARQAATEKAVHSAVNAIHAAATSLERRYQDFLQALDVLRVSQMQSELLAAPPVPRWQLN